MVYRPSKYTIVSPAGAGGDWSLFNTRSGVHLALERGAIPALETMLLLQTAGNSSIDISVLAQLTEAGILVTEGTDEGADLMTETEAATRADFGVRLAILPTLACNFECTYCFERRRQDFHIMAEVVQDAILAFVRTRLERESQGPLVVYWFGGEPLIALPVVRRLSAKLRAESAARGIEYSASISTNGFFLDRLTAEVTKELAISQITVSLDGPPETHDGRRRLLSGRGTFDRILESVKSTIAHFDNLVIRVNVDRANKDSVAELLRRLRDEGVLARARFDLAPVHSDTGACTMRPCTTLGANEWADFDWEMLRLVKDLGVADREAKPYPTPIPVPCSAAIRNAYAIDPEGNLYKCINDASFPDRAIANIVSGDKLNLGREAALKEVTLHRHDKCSGCQYLPVCQGGCPAARVDFTGGEPICTPWRFSLGPRLAVKAHVQRNTVAAVNS